MMKPRLLLLTVALALVSVSGSATAEDRAYQCQDKNGGIVYQWTPCPGTEAEAQYQKQRAEQEKRIDQVRERLREANEMAITAKNEAERLRLQQQQQQAVNADLAREAAANKRFADAQNYRTKAQEYRDQAAVSRAYGWQSSEIFERTQADEYERRAKELEQ